MLHHRIGPASGHAAHRRPAADGHQFHLLRSRIPGVEARPRLPQRRAVGSLRKAVHPQLLRRDDGNVINSRRQRSAGLVEHQQHRKFVQLSKPGDRNRDRPRLAGTQRNHHAAEVGAALAGAHRHSQHRIRRIRGVAFHGQPDPGGLRTERVFHLPVEQRVIARRRHLHRLAVQCAESDRLRRGIARIELQPDPPQRRGVRVSLEILRRQQQRQQQHREQLLFHRFNSLSSF